MEMSTASRKVLTACVALFVLAAVTGCDVISPVYMPDKALSKVVRAAVGKPLGVVTRADMAKLKELQAAGMGVVDLQGLQYCESLSVLNLSGNAVVSLAPLAGLRNLARVNLSDNQLGSVEALSGWFYLEELQLYGEQNLIWDWRPLLANVQAGGLGAGNILVLPTATTLDSNSNPLPGFAEAQKALIEQDVKVTYGAPGETTDGTTDETQTGS
ncbi:MAG: leucine-rich repeat domain-containing protein [Candidatus Hydrogenedentes bacterium]|nr:leucine-rich repeat domain-containing protein [Candidatus Hydrogenedentota bacterium]